MRMAGHVFGGILLCLAGAQSHSPLTAVRSHALVQTNSQGPETPPQGGKIVSQVDVVSVIFTVVDGRGRFVKDLKENQFKILDNGRPPKELIKFEAPTDLP